MDDSLFDFEPETEPVLNIGPELIYGDYVLTHISSEGTMTFSSAPDPLGDNTDLQTGESEEEGGGIDVTGENMNVSDDVSYDSEDSFVEKDNSGESDIDREEIKTIIKSTFSMEKGSTSKKFKAESIPTVKVPQFKVYKSQFGINLQNPLLIYGLEVLYDKKKFTGKIVRILSISFIKRELTIPLLLDALRSIPPKFTKKITLLIKEAEDFLIKKSKPKKKDKKEMQAEISSHELTVMEETKFMLFGHMDKIKLKPSDPKLLYLSMFCEDSNLCTESQQVLKSFMTESCLHTKELETMANIIKTAKTINGPFWRLMETDNKPTHAFRDIKAFIFARKLIMKWTKTTKYGHTHYIIPRKYQAQGILDVVKSMTDYIIIHENDQLKLTSKKIHMSELSISNSLRELKGYIDAVDIRSPNFHVDALRQIKGAKDTIGLKSTDLILKASCLDLAVKIRTCTDSIKKKGMVKKMIDSKKYSERETSILLATPVKKNGTLLKGLNLMTCDTKDINSTLSTLPSKKFIVIIDSCQCIGTMEMNDILSEVVKNLATFKSVVSRKDKSLISRVYLIGNSCCNYKDVMGEPFKDICYNLKSKFTVDEEIKGIIGHGWDSLSRVTELIDECNPDPIKGNNLESEGNVIIVVDKVQDIQELRRKYPPSVTFLTQYNVDSKQVSPSTLIIHSDRIQTRNIYNILELYPQSRTGKMIIEGNLSEIKKKISSACSINLKNTGLLTILLDSDLKEKSL